MSIIGLPIVLTEKSKHPAKYTLPIITVNKENLPTQSMENSHVILSTHRQYQHYPRRPLREPLTGVVGVARGQARFIRSIPQAMQVTEVT